MRGMRHGTGGYKTRHLKNHSAHHLHGLRQVLSNGEMITDNIIKYFNENNPQLSVDEFKKIFPYPLYYLPIDLTMKLYRSICVCKDGMIRSRQPDSDDSGIVVTAITGSKKWI